MNGNQMNAMAKFLWMCSNEITENTYSNETQPVQGGLSSTFHSWVSKWKMEFQRQIHGNRVAALQDERIFSFIPVKRWRNCTMDSQKVFTSELPSLQNPPCPSWQRLGKLQQHKEKWEHKRMKWFLWFRPPIFPS